MFAIARREQLSATTFLWDVEAPDVARAAKPGHFVMVRLADGGERIPLTVADVDPSRGTVTIVVQALGRTTRQMMTDYRQGDRFQDFVGPLGLPQHIARVGHVVLVGGGLGVAPVYPQLRAFKAAGNRVTGIIGFRTKDLVFWEDRFREACDELVVCTDDGSAGRKGLVTSALAEVCAANPPQLVVAIGPLPMMQACAEVTRPSGVRTMVSLNAIMVDGTGMCGSCRVTVGEHVKFACVDGPDFDGHRVDFRELMARQRRFHGEERTANDDYAHVCELETQLFVEGKRNYKKLKDLAPHQTRMPERDPEERAANFEEVNLGYSLADALTEAERCIQCTRPTCISGCPVHIDIPRFIRHLAVRDLDGALSVINESSPLPSVCGRVCPQESQCEAQCIIGKKLEPVAIGRLERFVGDHGRRHASLPRRPESRATLGRVAICGSGPAGLAAAADLVKLGCEVTVFEALHVVGGVLRYGIPSFRLPRTIIDREVQRLTDQGVHFVTNAVIGKLFTVEQLLTEKGFSAVFLAVGAGAPSLLGIPGESAGQVYSANEFLTRVNLMGGDRFPLQDTPVTVGKSVAVIGAGNTAMDCLRVARRLGVPTVRCVYRRGQAEAPARVEELRHAKEEGVEFMFLHSPVAILTDEAGNVRALKVEEMALGEPDAKGRRAPKGTGVFKELPCDTVISALGTRANPIISQSSPSLALTHKGHVAADDGGTQCTNLPGVFAGGDIVSGGATVILAMGAGRRAARAIATWLQQGRSAWPVTAEQVAAFVPRGEEPATPPSTPLSRLAASEPASRAPATPLAPSAAATTPVASASGTSPAAVSASAPSSPEATSAPHAAHAEPASARTCPRCHQPLEGDEAYICCAGESLTWRCTACAKVSEGFALPFGRCPSCGGAFEHGGAASARSAGALEAVRLAFEIELGGQAFYATAAREAPDEVMRLLFGRLAAMEREHLATLVRRYHLPAPRVEDLPLARAAHVGEVPRQPEDPGNLFRIAIALEQRAVRFFTERGEAVPPGSPEHRLYRELAAEEREHVELLTTEFNQWTRGRAGLLG